MTIGPEYGTVTPQQVKEAAKEAVSGIGFDILIVCGFAFDPHVSEEAKRYGKLTVLPARMNPDLLIGATTSQEHRRRQPVHGLRRARHRRPEEGQPGESSRAEPAQPLLVFDEIDAGIGGHTAIAVGAHLQQLARGRQVLCITHLPQVAAAAARHFTIRCKHGSEVPARTSVTALDGDEVVGELVRMLGAGDGDRAASQHARQLLRQAA